MAVVPFAAAAVRAGSAWTPTGDVAVIVLRARDVLTRHTPLVGMPTSLGLLVGREVHHPGPSEFWYLRLIQVLLPFRWGPMAGTAALGAAEAVVVVRAAWVTAGARAAAVVAAVLSVVTWNLGGMAVLPWNPFVAAFALPVFVASLVACVRGRRWWLVAAAVSGTVAAQAQLAMAIVVAGAALAAVAASVRRWRAARAWLVPTVGAAGALAVLWAPVLWDEVFGGGNLSSIVASGNGGTKVVDPSLAGHVVANALGSPVWLRPVTVQPATVVRVVSGPSAVAGVIAAVVIGCALAVGVLGRRRAPTAAATSVVALGALGAGVLAVLRLPDQLYTVLALHNFLWSCALAGTAVALAGAAAVRRLPLRAGALVLAVALAVVTVRAVVATPPFPDQERWAPAIAPAAKAVRAATRPGRTYLVDLGDDLDAFGVGAGIVLGLEQAGVDVRVPVRWAPSFGSHRAIGRAVPDAAFAVQVDGHPLVAGDPVFSYRLADGGRVVILRRPPEPAGP